MAAGCAGVGMAEVDQIEVGIASHIAIILIGSNPGEIDFPAGSSKISTHLGPIPLAFPFIHFGDRFHTNSGEIRKRPEMSDTHEADAGDSNSNDRFCSH